jgi:hypothetical protein
LNAAALRAAALLVSPIGMTFSVTEYVERSAGLGINSVCSPLNAAILVLAEMMNGKADVRGL